MENELHKIKSQLPENSAQPQSIQAAPQTAQEFAKGEVIDERFKIIKLLGRGGMGSVYEIEHLHLHARYAMKILSKGHTNDASWRRFEIEARATNKLDHPNLIKVHDFGLLPDGQPFFIMDLVEGETLGDVLKRRGRLSVEQAVKLFIQVGFALSYAHSNGIVHRDIKPSNIILTKGSTDKTEDSLVKLVDFGIAKLTGQDGFSQQTLTRTGEIFGSPLYMSPEQCMGVAVDHRSDIYSLGCVLFEALTGAPPLVGDSALATMMKHQSEAPPTLKEASMGIEYPKRIEQVVARLLEKDSSSRYQSAELLTADLVGLDSNQLSTVSLTPMRKEKDLDSITLSKPAIVVFALVLYFLGLDIGLIIPQPETKEFQKVGDTLKFEHLFPKDIEMNPSKTGANASRAFAVVNPTFEAESKKNAYFSKPGPNGSRTFYFPDMNIGDCRVGTSQPTESPWVVKNFQGIYFKPNYDFRRHPKLFRRFREDDISNLNLSNNRTFINQVSDNTCDMDDDLPYISHLKKLISLSGADSRLTAKGIEYLNQLPNLKDLRLDRTELSGPQLARLKTLPDLTALTLYTVDDVKPILEKLRKSKVLQFLQLIDCHLDSEQVSLLSNTPVERLDLTHNPMVTEDCIDRLPVSLKRLDVVDCKITGKSAAKFARLKNLHFLNVDNRYWTTDEAKLLGKLLPRAAIVIQHNEKLIR